MKKAYGEGEMNKNKVMYENTVMKHITLYTNFKKQ